jgi:hypothetical protein
MVNPNPFEPIVISILIEHEKIIRNLNKKSSDNCLDFINALDLK